jgi:hypothetical protein
MPYNPEHRILITIKIGKKIKKIKRKINADTLIFFENKIN